MESRGDFIEQYIADIIEARGCRGHCTMYPDCTCNFSDDDCRKRIGEFYDKEQRYKTEEAIKKETELILERLDEVVDNMGGCIESELCGEDLPNGATLGCGYCLAFYIKHGRMITEKDLDNA